LLGGSHSLQGGENVELSTNALRITGATPAKQTLRTPNVLATPAMLTPGWSPACTCSAHATRSGPLAARARAQALRAFTRARARMLCARFGRMEDYAATPTAGRTPLRDGSSTPGSVHGSVHGSVAGRSVAGTTTPRVARDEFSINTDDSDDMLGGRHRDVEQQVPVGSAVERWNAAWHSGRAERCACTCRTG
jgi:hypothetical protein